MDTTLQDTVAFILSANADEMGKINVAMKERYGQLRRIDTIDALTRFSIGDHVEICGNISPKYLVGVTGQILRLEGNRFAVSLDYAVGRYHGVIRVPANCLKEAS